MSKSFDIKKLCDESLNELFSKEYFEKRIKRKELKNNSEPLYSDLDRRIAFIVHAVTIRSGIILEKIYFNQIKNCCSHLDVWSEEKFKISKHAMQIASDQDNKDVMNTDCPYGETYKIGKKRKKTRQIDLLTYDKKNKILNSYEIKRGGGHHDSEKQEKIIENLIAVKLLLKDYGIKEKKLEVKKYKSFIISHMNQELFSPNYRFLQVNGDEVDQHFNSKIKVHIDKDYDYFVSEFKKRFKELKLEAVN